MKLFLKTLLLAVLYTAIAAAGIFLGYCFGEFFSFISQLAKGIMIL